MAIEWLPVREYALRRGVSRQQIYKDIKNGKIAEKDIRKKNFMQAIFIKYTK